ncbi:type VI secretion system lipoprotein TssJ [Rubellimicrobium arenae]|uniref:type VI secretion system lipoprotein TssJ n=1 Tax=Rubellimicrobium arenae TaxID=2817372 RepID=UPI001FEF6874|nr:type VI secretion system lipoprotein TssJ [Rubellimicrobium arenae]
MTDRRTLLLGGGALALLAVSACAKPEEEPPPAAATITATGAAGANPGPDGADRPLTLTVLQLRSASAFEAADFFALQTPETALGGDLVSATQIALTPGGTASTVVPLDPATTALGIVGGYRDPAGKAFRVVAPVTPGSSVNLNLAATSSGVAISPA